MTRLSRAGLLGSALLLAAPSALADDSSAELGAGGIVLTKNADIRMATEDLYISPKQVKVHYTFVNDGKADIDTIVAFLEKRPAHFPQVVSRDMPPYFPWWEERKYS